MAKFLRGRPSFTTSGDDAGDVVTGRQLLGAQGNDNPREFSLSGATLASPHGVPRDISFYGYDKPASSVVLSPAADASVALTVGEHDHFNRGYALQTRTIITDPRVELLDSGRWCGTHEYGEKTFNGYERAHADDRTGASLDRLGGHETWDEGTLNVTVGGTVSGVIDETGDQDFITVTLTAGETYSFYLYGSGGTPVTDTFLTLLGTDGTTVINEDDDGGVGLYSLITYTAATTGTYTLVAESFSNPGDPGLGDWTLAVHQQGADEAPSAPPSAVPATLGLNYGFISPAGTDEDVYSINLTAGFIYNFEVAGGADYNTDFLSVPAGEIDTIIRVYDSAGTLLFTNDDIDFPDDISSALGFIPETSGTYYVEIDGYSGQSGGYVLEITETDLATLDPLDAIDWGGPLNVVDNSDTLLIYFATEGEVYDDVEDLGGWTPYLQQQALAAFQTYSQFANLTFAITTDQSEADFTLVTTTSDEFLAYFNPPGTTNAGVGVFAVNGTGWDEDGSLGSMEPGGYGWITFIHEFGHGLGMAHPHDNGGGSEVIPGVTGPFGSYGIFDLNQGVYTTMSYNDGWQFHPDVDSNGFPVPDTLDYGYQGTPMALDIALMQIKYGAVAANTGNTTYELGAGNVAGTYYQAIWDTGGTDEIVYNGTADATIDLTAATLDYSATGAGVLSWVDGVFGGFTIANGVVIENASGGSGNDILVGNSAENVLTGNEGNDSFVGGEGDDTFEGGDGIDTAIYFGNQADYTITAIAGGFTITDNNLADGDDGTDTFLDGEQVQFADGLVNLFDAPGNQAPTLTGLSSSVVFNEQAVNAAAQLIDSDVTLTDTDNNFDGGTLTVSGALAEDVIGIRNQGSLAGQVGVSGANVTYGGVVIGTFTGGTGGTTLTVTFNNQASTLAVEAVIENLTYANASNSPTADRTLTLNVTDDEGASLIGSTVTPGPFVELTGPNDPLGGLPAFGAGPNATAVDVNGDGDLDLVVGDQPGTLRYFENNGAGYTEVTGASNPFNTITLPVAGAVGYSTPETIDIDGDGDLDLIFGLSGASGGMILTFQNNGAGSWTQLTGAANPMNGFDVGNFSDAAAGDFDGDGDQDIVVGAGGSGAANNGQLAYFQNNGGVFTQLTGASNPFNGIDVGSYSSPTGGDIDGDGDIDLLVGAGDGTITAFLNNGSGVFTNAGAANPLNGIDFGAYAYVTLTDIDGDGFKDIIVGDGDGGDTRVFRNTSTITATPAPTIQIHVNAQNDAPSGTSGSATILENTSYTFDAADFGFSDVLEGDDFAGVVITTLPGNGALTLNNVAVTAGQFVTIADINGGLLVFTPDTEENGANYASFTFQVRDDGGTANGGIDTDPTPNTFSFEVTPDNFAPELTDLDSPVTFLENTVNATPQLLDTDVTLTDDNGFANGSLVVSGLLAEDVVGILSDGTGPGQISVTGTDVSYGGVLIGTLAGGIGNDLVVTFNGAVTTAAAEALIEHLTYANTSDTPTESRTLTIQIYDDEGLGLVSTTSFTEATGGDNPFDGFSTPGAGSFPTFVDVDGDGDLDLVAGNQDGYLQTWANNGDGTFTELTGAANPFDGFSVGASGTYSAPAAIDVDGDGDVDLVVGSNYGDLAVLLNDGNGGWTDDGFLSGVSVSAFSTPTAVDLDGDGLQDLVLGNNYGFFYGFINNGDGSFTELTGVNDPFLTISVPYFSTAGFVDIDGDGDFDLVAGDYYGGVTVFTNDGGVFTEAMDQPFSGETFSSVPAFTFVDLDGDGDLDGVVGSFDGDFRTFVNNGGSNQIVVNVTPENEPVELYDLDDNLVSTYGTIQEAVDAAQNGYRISITSGTYVEQVVVDGLTDLTIEAAPGATVTIEAPDTLVVTGQHAANHNGGVDVYGVVTVLNSENITISGITIDGASAGDSVPTQGPNFAGVFFRNSSGELVDVDITGVHSSYVGGTTGDGFPNLAPVQHGTGVVVDNDTLLAFTMTGGSIEDFQKNAGRFWEADLDISGVTVTGGGAQTTGPAQNGFVVDSGTGSISGNTITAIGYAGAVVAYSVIVYVRGATDLDVTDNVLTGTNGTTTAAQVLGIAYYDDNAANNGGNITGNTISFVDTGIDVEGALGAPAIVINGNIVTDIDPNDPYSPSGVYFLPEESNTLSFIIGGSNVHDELYGAAGNDHFRGFDGDDILEGGAGTDILEGGAGKDTLIGGVGADTMLGGADDDFYIVDDSGDVVTEAAGEGFDAVYTSVSFALAADSEVEWLSTIDNAATTNINLTGSDTANYLIGNQGSNFLNGAGGADIMYGYGGDDAYVVDNAGDVVTEVAGEGFDAIYTSIDYVLAANNSIEWLSAANNASTAALNLTGNNLSNYLIGNAGVNVLDGGTGADLMYGLGGNDSYYVDNFGDRVFEGTGNGFDAVFVSVNNYTLEAGQEIEWLSTADNGSSASFNLTGNELAQFIIGNAGTNVITGGGGADTLIGLGGNDYYYVTTGTSVIEAVGGGYDSVLASSSFTLNNGSEVEFIGTTDSTGTTAINLTGNEFDNVIYGNAGANVLDGKGGNDMLLGLAGADTFAFTTALGANNVDIVFGFEHGVDKIALDDAIFTAIGGLGALNANAFVTGSAAADASDRIIYNSATGQLYYDADGTGAGAAVLFATLSPGLNLTASDFQVI